MDNGMERVSGILQTDNRGKSNTVDREDLIRDIMSLSEEQLDEVLRRVGMMMDQI